MKNLKKSWFAVSCHICHALFTYFHLVVNALREMLKMTANEFKTKLGVYVVFAFVFF